MVLAEQKRAACDVGVGIVAGQVFLIQPQHPFCAQVQQQLLFYFLWLRPLSCSDLTGIV